MIAVEDPMSRDTVLQTSTAQAVASWCFFVFFFYFSLFLSFLFDGDEP